MMERFALSNSVHGHCVDRGSAQHSRYRRAIGPPEINRTTLRYWEARNA